MSIMERGGAAWRLQKPYKGMAPAMNDLISGQIAVGFVNITAQVVALHRGGKIRILAVNAPERLEALPDIPTTDEAGLPNFISQTFFGLFGPSGTPKAALERIDQATQTAWSDADFRKRLVEAGFEPMLGFGPDKADAYLKQEIARWSPIVQKVGSQTQ
jgi:tripartite-type tricarboxylate transporter receptor subunit TctC